MDRSIYTALFVLLLSLTAPVNSVAQTENDFKWIQIGVAGQVVYPFDGYENWSPLPAASIRAQTPFYGGRLEMSLVGRYWSADGESLPDFATLFASAGWALTRPVGSEAHVLVGTRLGNYWMNFQTDQIGGARRESELAVEPFVELEFRVVPRVFAFVEASFLRVFTNPILDDISGRAGLALRFETPVRLRRWLQ